MQFHYKQKQLNLKLLGFTACYLPLALALPALTQLFEVSEYYSNIKVVT
jgi:hypothetical protein